MAKRGREASRKIAQTKNTVSPSESTPSSSGGAHFPIDELPNEILEGILILSLPDALANPRFGSHIAYVSGPL